MRLFPPDPPLTPAQGGLFQLGFQLPNTNVFVYDYAESQGPHGRCEEDRSEVPRNYFTLWDYRKEAIRGLIGYARTTGGAGMKYVARLVPHSLPDWLIFEQTIPYLYCTSCDWYGYSPVQTEIKFSRDTPNGEKVPVHLLVRLDCMYQTLPYDILSDAQMISSGYTDAFGNPDESTWRRYCTVIPKAAGEFFTVRVLGTGGFNYVSDPQLVSLDTARLLVSANLAVTRYGVPADSVPSIHANRLLTGPGALELGLGKVNSLAMNGYPAGTLLLTAVEFKPKRSPFGIRIYDYTTYLKYIGNPNPTGGDVVGHNYLYRPVTTAGTPLGQWTEVTLGGITNIHTTPPEQIAGKSIYDWFDHRKLYRNQ